MAVMRDPLDPLKEDIQTNRKRTVKEQREQGEGRSSGESESEGAVARSTVKEQCKQRQEKDNEKDNETDNREGKDLALASADKYSLGLPTVAGSVVDVTVRLLVSGGCPCTRWLCVVSDLTLQNQPMSDEKQRWAFSRQVRTTSENDK